MPSLYGTDLSPNALKTRESSRFGTRPLAFYTFITDEANGLVDTAPDSNSLYYRVVQALQESGVELYWLGEPKNGTDAPGPNGSEAFTFAIADDADTPFKYLADSATYTVLGANLDGYNNYLKLDVSNPNLLNIGQPVVFGMTDDGVIAGKTYYIYSWDTDNGATYIRLSETVSQRNTDGTPDYPEGVGHPGEIFQLDIAPSANTYSATFSFYDTYWSGTAGDVQWTCCWDPDFKTIEAYGLGLRVLDIIGAIPNGGFNIYRCQVTGAGVFPIFGCCC
jgi:hypothetical protein